MRAELIEIKGDLYDVAARLREIDSEYRLFYNTKLCRFEVYASGALQIAAPFEELDCRLIEHARKTRIENRKKLISEIERNNAILEARAEAAAKDKLFAAL